MDKAHKESVKQTESTIIITDEQKYDFKKLK